MKKLILTLLILSLFMTGCSSPKKTATCTLGNETIIGYANQDTIEKIEVTLVTTLAELEITAEKYDTFVADLKNAYSSVEGIESTITKEGDTVTIFLSSDYTVMQPVTDPTGFAEFVRNLKNDGYTCKIK